MDHPEINSLMRSIPEIVHHGMKPDTRGQDVGGAAGSGIAPQTRVVNVEGEILPLWLIGGAGVLGLAAMVVTMAFPDNLEYYWPLFHFNAVWLAGIGIVVFTSGIVLRG